MMLEHLTIWPPDYDGENLRRLKRSFRLHDDRRLQIAIMKHYRDNPIDFINDWCVTFDPRLEGAKKIPFILFPRQRDFVELIVECIKTRESCLVEKCRDVGASWICVALSVWLWIFVPGATVGWGSRKEEYVDQKGNPKAIFPKIRQIIGALPYWMLPYGFNMRDHAPYMKIINPATDATITGEAGDNIGRGGRSTIFFKDEAAHYEHPELVEAALSENTDVQVDISSVNGSANVFYRRRMAGEIWYPGKAISSGITRVFIFDWHDHPGKSQDWYDKKRAKFESEGLLHVFAQEIDRDYASSIDNIIIRPEWVEAAVDAHIKLGIKPMVDKVAGQDIADGGGDKNALAIRHGVILTYCDHWAGLADDAPSIAKPPCIEFGVKMLYYDSVGVGVGFRAGMKKIAWPESIKVHAWSGADSVLDPDRPVIPGDRDSPKNEDQYLNLKAQAWFRLRNRFIKTYNAVRNGEKFDHNELISLDSKLPRLHELKMELSQAVHKPSANGKTMVEKKPNGALSPNMADAIVMCYCPTAVRTSFFTM